jgi:hypothetical protein
MTEAVTVCLCFQVFGLVTATCCLADGALIYRKLLFNPSGPYQKKPDHDKSEVL